MIGGEDDKDKENENLLKALDMLREEEKPKKAKRSKKSKAKIKERAVNKAIRDLQKFEYEIPSKEQRIAAKTATEYLKQHEEEFLKHEAPDEIKATQPQATTPNTQPTQSKPEQPDEAKAQKEDEKRKRRITKGAVGIATIVCPPVGIGAAAVLVTVSLNEKYQNRQRATSENATKATKPQSPPPDLPKKRRPNSFSRFMESKSAKEKVNAEDSKQTVTTPKEKQSLGTKKKKSEAATQKIYTVEDLKGFADPAPQKPPIPGLPASAKMIDRVKNEVFETEVTYLNFLNTVDNATIIKALNAYNRLTPEQLEGKMSQAELFELISKMKEISVAQEKVFESLKSSEPNQWGATLKTVEKLYAEYTVLLKDANLPDGVNVGVTQPGGKSESLASILIQPVQRMPRMALFAREFVKESKTHADFENVIKEICDNINEAKRKTEHKEATVILDNAVKNYAAKPKKVENLSTLISALQNPMVAPEEKVAAIKDLNFDKLTTKHQALLDETINELNKKIKSKNATANSPYAEEDAKQKAKNELAQLEKNKLILENLKHPALYLKVALTPNEGKDSTAGRYAADLKERNAQLLAKITFEELKSKEPDKSKGISAINLEASILNNFIISDLLQSQSKKEFDQKFDFYVEVAKHSIQTNDFQSASTIKLALASSNINSLLDPSEKAKPEGASIAVSKKLAALESLLSPLGNNQNLRNYTSTLPENASQVPVVGILTRDAIHAKEGKKVDDKALKKQLAAFQENAKGPSSLPNSDIGQQLDSHHIVSDKKLSDISMSIKEDRGSPANFENEKRAGAKLIKEEVKQVDPLPQKPVEPGNPVKQEEKDKSTIDAPQKAQVQAQTIAPKQPYKYNNPMVNKKPTVSKPREPKLPMPPNKQSTAPKQPTATKPPVVNTSSNSIANGPLKDAYADFVKTINQSFPYPNQAQAAKAIADNIFALSHEGLSMAAALNADKESKQVRVTLGAMGLSNPKLQEQLIDLLVKHRYPENQVKVEEVKNKEAEKESVQNVVEPQPVAVENQPEKPQEKAVEVQVSEQKEQVQAEPAPEKPSSPAIANGPFKELYKDFVQAIHQNQDADEVKEVQKVADNLFSSQQSPGDLKGKFLEELSSVLVHPDVIEKFGDIVEKQRSLENQVNPDEAKKSQPTLKDQIAARLSTPPEASNVTPLPQRPSYAPPSNLPSLPRVPQTAQAFNFADMFLKEKRYDDMAKLIQLAGFHHGIAQGSQSWRFSDAEMINIQNRIAEARKDAYTNKDMGTFLALDKLDAQFNKAFDKNIEKINKLLDKNAVSVPEGKTPDERVFVSAYKNFQTVSNAMDTAQKLKDSRPTPTQDAPQDDKKKSHKL